MCKKVLIFLKDNTFRNFTKSSKGSAIIVVLLVLLVLTMLGIALFQYFNSDIIHVKNDEDGIQAFYIARSAADSAAEYIVSNPDNLTPDNMMNFVQRTLNSKGTGSQEGKTYEVISTGDVNSTITVTATGHVNNAARTAKIKIIRMSSQDIFEDAIFAQSDLKFTGNMQNMFINGNIESNGIVMAPDSSHFTGSALQYSTRVFPPPSFPTGLSLKPDITVINGVTTTINSNSEYKLINVNNGGILNFDTSSGNLEVVVDELYNNGQVVVTGAGKLFLFIKKRFEIQTKGWVNNTDPNKLYVFLDTGSTLYSQAGQTLKGYIYGPSATVDMNSGNLTVDGSIISSIFIGNNNASVTYVQPSDTDIISIFIKGFRKGEWSE